MPIDSRLAAKGPVLLLVCAAVTACMTPPPPTIAAPPPAVAPAPVASAPVAEPAPPPASPAPTLSHPLEPVLAYADRLRGLPPSELAAEVQRLGESAYTPERALQFAVALTQSRNGAQVGRAQQLLQRVLADPEARPFHPFARMLAAQLTEQRRVEEQAERQAQQLRDAQRRIDQLNDRLEAVRAIERSVPPAPRRDNDLPPPARGAASRPGAP